MLSWTHALCSENTKNPKVPKDFGPVVLTSMALKSFEKLVKPQTLRQVDVCFAGAASRTSHSRLYTCY